MLWHRPGYRIGQTYRTRWRTQTLHSSCTDRPHLAPLLHLLATFLEIEENKNMIQYCISGQEELCNDLFLIF